MKASSRRRLTIGSSSPRGRMGLKLKLLIFYACLGFACDHEVFRGSLSRRIGETTNRHHEGDWKGCWSSVAETGVKDLMSEQKNSPDIPIILENRRALGVV